MYQPPEGQPQPPQAPYYPPGYPPQQPMQQPPPKKKRRWPFVLLGVVLLCCAILGIIIAASGGGSSTASTNATATTAPTRDATGTPAPTAKPTQAPKWTTVQTFSGNGSKKTGTFSVPDDWKINWTCNPASFQGLDYNVIITVYNSDGSLADSGVNSTCKKGAPSGSTEIHTSGTVYLDIVSEGDWQVQVQELK